MSQFCRFALGRYLWGLSREPAQQIIRYLVIYPFLCYSKAASMLGRVSMCPERMMANAAPRLEKELATYQRLLPELTGKEGKFALIAGDDLLGVFDTYSDALDEGYRERGLEPFLVKRISAVEVISFFSRDLRPCHTLQTSL